MKRTDARKPESGHAPQSSQPFFGAQAATAFFTPGQSVQRDPFFQHGVSASVPLQAKLTVGAVGDKYEQEADRVAATVVDQINRPAGPVGSDRSSVQRLGGEEEVQMRRSLDALQRVEQEEELQMKPIADTIQRMGPAEEDELQMKPDLLQRETDPEEEDELQMKPMPDIAQRQGMEEDELQMKGAISPQVTKQGGDVSSGLESAIQQARAGGQAIAENVRVPLEQAFGADFSGVRVHTDAKSDQLNQSIQAKAFTTGQDVFFRQGAYEPRSRGGQELIAHELTHVVQQNGSPVRDRVTETVPALSHTVSHRPASTIQRMVGTLLILKDPIIIRKHGVQGRIISVYNPVSGKYFVTTATGIGFGELDGAYGPEELDFVKAFNYSGRDKIDLPMNESVGETGVHLHAGTSSTEMTSQGGNEEDQSEDDSTDDSFDIAGDTQSIGFNDGYDQGFEDGVDQKEQQHRFLFGRSIYSENEEYCNAYKEGYFRGLNVGKQEASETGYQSYRDREREELKQDEEYLKGTSLYKPPASESEANERKQNAKNYFEEFVEKNGSRSTEEILELLLWIKEHFKLKDVSYTIAGEDLTIAYYASPPDYSHLKAVHGASSKGESDHSVVPTAFTNKAASLQPLSKDLNIKTPLKAIMDALGLKASQVALLVKSDLETADRPKRVQATVVGARRKKALRVGGAIQPGLIANLGHQEQTLLSKDPSTWLTYYDGGHLVGDQLMPSKGPDTFVEWNLAPMEQVLNQQSYLHFVENVVAAGAVDSKNKNSTSIQISLVVSVYYPSQNYTVQEKDLAASGFIPNDKTIKKTGFMLQQGGKPLSNQNRTVTIPSRVPYKWVLHAKLTDPSHVFKAKTASPSLTSKTGNTAFPYFNYSLPKKVKEIPFNDRHWWILKGANKDVKTGAISTAKKQQEMHFEAYQYYPKR